MNSSQEMMEKSRFSTKKHLLARLLLTTIPITGPALAAQETKAATPATFIYTANQIRNTISAFSLASDGNLAPVPGGPFLAESYPVAIAHSADGRYLYNVNQGSASISAFKIDHDSGALTALPGSPYTTPFAYPDAITLSADGKIVFVTAEDGNLLMAWPRDPDNGGLLTRDSQTVATGRHPIDIVLTPDQRTALVANFDDNSVSVYRFIDGQLSSQKQVVATDEHPIHITVSRSGRFAYVANYGSTTVSAFRIAKNGQLSEISGSPFFAGAQPYSVVIDPRQQTLYSANWGSHDVSAFQIDERSGQLHELPDFRFKSGWFPYDIVVSPDDHHVYVANNGESTISVYNRDNNGELKTLSGPIDSDLGPYAMTIVAAAKRNRN